MSQPPLQDIGAWRKPDQRSLSQDRRAGTSHVKWTEGSKCRRCPSNVQVAREGQIAVNDSKTEGCGRRSSYETSTEWWMNISSVKSMSRCQLVSIAAVVAAHQARDEQHFFQVPARSRKELHHFIRHLLGPVCTCRHYSKFLILGRTWKVVLPESGFWCLAVRIAFLTKFPLSRRTQKSVAGLRQTARRLALIKRGLDPLKSVRPGVVVHALHPERDSKHVLQGAISYHIFPLRMAPYQRDSPTVCAKGRSKDAIPASGQRHGVAIPRATQSLFLYEVLTALSSALVSCLLQHMCPSQECTQVPGSRFVSIGAAAAW